MCEHMSSRLHPTCMTCCNTHSHSDKDSVHSTNSLKHDTRSKRKKINSNFYTQAKWILSVRGHECPSSQQSTLRKKKKSHNYTRTTDAHMSSYKLLTAKLVVLIIKQMMTFNTTRDLREKSEKKEKNRRENPPAAAAAAHMAEFRHEPRISFIMYPVDATTTQSAREQPTRMEKKSCVKEGVPFFAHR